MLFASRWAYGLRDVSALQHVFHSQAGLLRLSSGTQKRKDYPDDMKSPQSAKKPKQKYFRPSGMQVEVVIPRIKRRSTSMSTSTSGGAHNPRATSSVPSITSTSSTSRVASRPTPRLRVEVELPGRPDLVQKARVVGAAPPIIGPTSNPATATLGAAPATYNVSSPSSRPPIASYPSQPVQNGYPAYYAAAAAAASSPRHYWSSQPYYAYGPYPYPPSSYGMSYYPTFPQPPTPTTLAVSVDPLPVKTSSAHARSPVKSKKPANPISQTLISGPRNDPLEPSPPPPSIE